MFRRFWGKYRIEIIISVLGVVSSIITAIIIDKSFSYNQAFMIAITIGIDIICISNKNLLSESHEQIKDELNVLMSFNDLYSLYNKMPIKWKVLAFEKISMLRKDLKLMADGKLYVSGPDLINYQADLLKNATYRVWAVHLALDERSLKRWDAKQTTKDFTTILIRANKKIRFGVKKKRIFVIDSDLLREQEIYRLWKKIIWQQKYIMHFQVRVITKQSCEKNKREIPKDMLLCDDEAVTVHFYDKEARGEVVMKKEEFETEKRIFEDYWEWGEKKLKY